MVVYLDNASTTKPSNEVIQEMAKGMAKYYANPSSIHGLGIECDKVLNTCRDFIAKKINASSDEIFFNSGASEGNNLILRGIPSSSNNIIITPFEHSSVKNTIKVIKDNNIEIRYLKLNSKGEIDILDLKSKIDKNTRLVSIIHVNNEIGVIQNLKEIGMTIKEVSSRAKFHVDCVQGFGKFEIDVEDMKIDSLVMSGHKINGPKGIGFTYIRKGIKPKALITGGSQEMGLRAGTENLPGIIGLRLAIENSYNEMNINYNKVYEIKKYMIEKLGKIKNVKINSILEENYSPYILNASFIGVRSEVLLNALTTNNVYVSTGSACTSKSKSGLAYSYVLEAIKLTKEEIEGAIRFSFSKDTTISEIDYTIECLENNLKFLRR